MLIALIIGRELVFWYNTHLLLNKLASRNYGDYLQAKQVGKANTAQGLFKDDSSVSEDLAPIHNILG